MERTYTIPLRKQWLKTPRYLRTNKAVRTVRSFLQRHMHAQGVKLGEHLNNALWSRGDTHPPHKVTVLAKKEENVVYAELFGKEFRKKEFSEKEEKTKKETRGLEAAAQAAESKEAEKPAERIIGEAAVAKAKEESKVEEKPVKAEKKTTKTRPASKKK